MEKPVNQDVEMPRFCSPESLKDQDFSLLEWIGDGLLVMDNDWRILYVNTRAELLLGMHRNELLGKNHWEIFPLALGTRLEDEYRRAASGEMRDFVNYYDPWGRWFHNRCLPCESGGLVVFFHEIPAEECREITLKETVLQNELLANIIRYSSQPFGIGCHDGSIKLVNAALEQLVGYSEAELRSIDWATTLTPPEWRELEQAKLAELSRTGQPVQYEKEYLRKDSSRVPVRMLVHFIGETDTSPAYLYSFITDISEERAAGQQIRLSEERFRMFMDNSPAIAWMKDDAGRYVYVNRAYEQRFGTRKEDCLGKTDFDLWPEPFAAEYSRSDATVLKSCNPVDFCEEARDLQGNWSAWSVSKFLFNNVAGSRHVGGIGIDITERRKAEEQIKISEERLRKLNDELEQRVAERTALLTQANELLSKEISDRKEAEVVALNSRNNLQQRSEELEDANSALRVLLRQRETDKRSLEEQVQLNVRQLITPFVGILKQQELPAEAAACLQIIEKNLNNIVTSFDAKLSYGYRRLSHKEILVANLVKEGRQDKDIATILRLAPDTVKAHRRSIRKKLGLTGEKANLRSCLLSLENG